MMKRQKWPALLVVLDLQKYSQTDVERDWLCNLAENSKLECCDSHMLIFDVIDGFEVEWKMMAQFSDEIHLDLLGKWMLVQQRMRFYHLPMLALQGIRFNRLVIKS